MRVHCAPMQVLDGGSTKVSLGLTDEVFRFLTTKSTVGNYDGVPLCNGVQYKAGAALLRQICAIGGNVVVHSVLNWATAKGDGYVAR